MQELRVLEYEHAPHLGVDIEPARLVSRRVERRRAAFEVATACEGVIQVKLDREECALAPVGRLVCAVAVALRSDMSVHGTRFEEGNALLK